LGIEDQSLLMKLDKV